MKTAVRNIIPVICSLLIIIGLFILCSDALMRWFGMSGSTQLIFNVVYLLVCPFLIYASGWVEFIRNLK